VCPKALEDQAEENSRPQLEIAGLRPDDLRIVWYPG